MEIKKSILPIVIFLILLSVSVSSQVLTFSVEGDSVAMNGMNIAETTAKADYPSPNLMVTYSLGSGQSGATASAPSEYSSTGALVQSDFGEGKRWYYVSQISRVNDQNPFEGFSPVKVSWELPLLESKDWQQVPFKEGMAEIPQGDDAHFILNGQLSLPGKFIVYSAETDAVMAQQDISDPSKDCSTPNSRCSATVPTKNLPPGYYYIAYSDSNVKVSVPMAIKIGEPMDKGESTIIMKDPATGKDTAMKWTPKLATSTYVKGNVNNKKISVIAWRADYPSGISIGESKKNVVYDLTTLGIPGLTFEVETDWKTHTTLKFSNDKSLKLTKVDGKLLITPSSAGDWGNGLTASSADGKSFVLTSEKKAQLTTTLEEEECTPELIAKLNAEKAELEKMADDLEEEQRSLLGELSKVNSDLSSLKEKQASIADSVNSLSEKINNLQAASQGLDQRRSDLVNSIDKIQSRMNELTRILADSDGLGIHTGGGDPTQGMDSGGAISYDGGGTWITFKGNAGAQKYLDRMHKLKEIKAELVDLARQFADIGKEKQSIESQQKDMEKEKSSLEADLEARQNELSGLDKEIAGKEAERQQLSAKLDELAKNAEDLNDLIKAFNEKARKCGIEAHGTFLDAMAKLNKMPLGMRQQARLIFDGQASEKEKEVLAKSGYVGDEKTAEVITAADKLVSSMQDASKCEEGKTMKGELRTDVYEFTLHGVENVWIADWQGVRGLKMSQQQEIYEEISSGITTVDWGDLGLDIVDLLQDANPVGLIYSFGFQDPAVDAIMGQIKSWISQGALAGPPLWIQVGYGRLWEQEITKRTSSVDVYKCIEGIWQYSNTERNVDVERSECTYSDGGVHEYDVPLEELNWNPQSDASGSWSDNDAKNWAGRNPNGWSDSFNSAIREAFNEKLNGYVVGKCE